jgi:hypothetical protein
MAGAATAMGAGCVPSGLRVRGKRKGWRSENARGWRLIGVAIGILALR